MFIFSQTTDRNRIVSTSSTHLKDTHGLYQGFDLIPNLLEKDGSQKKCHCGVCIY